MAIIVYNLKAVAVALVVVLVFVASITMDLSAGFSFTLTGIAGIAFSVLLSEKGKGYAGMPTVFFIPTHVYSALILLLGVIGFWANPSLLDSDSEDQRFVMLEKDQDMLDSIQVSGSNLVLAINLQEYISYELMPQLKPQEIAYRVLENEKENKILVLMKFRLLSRLEKDDKKEFAGLVESFFLEDSLYQNKEVFIGIIGKRTLSVTKGRNGISTRLAVGSNLVPFYADSALTAPTK